MYQAQGQYAKALEYHQQALAIAREVGNRAGEGVSLNNIGGVYDEQRQYAKALEYHQQALVIRREVDDHAGEGVSLNNIGGVYLAQGEHAEALQFLGQAMDVVDTIRATAGSEHGRAAFVAEHASLYEHAVMRYHQQQQNEVAFQASERGRARAFLDSLATGFVQLSDQDAAGLFTREQETYVARQAAQEVLAKARTTNPANPTLVTELEQQLQTAEQQHTEALAAIELRGDELSALVPGRTSSVLDVPAVQQHLDRQATLVSFFVTEDQTLAFVLTHDRFQTVVLQIGRDGLRDQVSRLLDAPDFQTAAHPRAALALYTTLIAPLKSQLTTPHLLIVPHGPLHYLPFAALTDGQHFLGDDYLLSMLPSASTLPFIQARTGRGSGSPLILGNPDGTLPFAEREADIIAALYGVPSLVGSEATEAVLRERTASAGILHLAVHGRYDATNPLASQLTLAPSGGTEVPDADGRLEAAEVYGLNLQQTDLVVLSACQTNLGDVSAGDEVVGLTRAFFFAGTPTVISSLWSVDDVMTAELMERFYRHLQTGMGKAEALQAAQREVRATHPAPYYWAGFVLVGDAGMKAPIASPAMWKLSPVVGILVIIISMMAWLFYRRRGIP